jgi:transcriptional regulator with XRE-family HTH domain
MREVEREGMGASQRGTAMAQEHEHFGERLRELRVEKGWTQADLAERAGVSQRAITQWERSLRQPTWANVIALAGALGVATDAFRTEPAQSAPEKRKAGRPRKPTSGQGSPLAVAANGVVKADETKPKKRKGK